MNKNPVQFIVHKREFVLLDFFDQYSKRFNQALVNPESVTEDTASAFASCVIAASPNGVFCGKNDEKFIKAIPDGYAFYKKIGIKTAEIQSAKVTLLDEHHAMVEVTWRFFYTSVMVPSFIEFKVIYLMQTLNDDPKIFGYITGDEQKALKEHGLV